MKNRFEQKQYRSGWKGACLDTGARTIVICVNQAEAYSSFMNIRFMS